MKHKGWLIISAVIAILVLGINTRFSINAWFLLIDSAYIIPKESTVFTFKPTVMNAGSGDWWIYGEDKKFYYYFTGDEAIPYSSYLKEDAKKCSGFKSDDYSTWCWKRNVDRKKPTSQ